MGEIAFLAYGEGADPAQAFTAARDDLRTSQNRGGFSRLLDRATTYTIVDDVPTSMSQASRRAADLLIGRDTTANAASGTAPDVVGALAILGGPRTLTVTVPPREDGWPSVADAVHAATPLADGEAIQGTPTGTYDIDEHTHRVAAGTATVTVAGGATHTGWLFFGWSPA